MRIKNRVGAKPVLNFTVIDQCHECDDVIFFERMWRFTPLGFMGDYFHCTQCVPTLPDAVVKMSKMARRQVAARPRLGDATFDYSGGDTCLPLPCVQSTPMPPVKPPREI